MEKPAVATRFPLVERTFPRGEVVKYEPGDPDDLARAVLAIVSDPAARAARVLWHGPVAEMSWEQEAKEYVALVERTIRRAHGRSGSTRERAT